MVIANSDMRLDPSGVGQGRREAPCGAWSRWTSSSSASRYIEGGPLLQNEGPPGG